MRHPSPEAWELLSLLHRSACPGRAVLDDARARDILLRLEALAEPATVPQLLGVALVSRPRPEAVRAIAAGIRATPITELPWLDEAVRVLWPQVQLGRSRSKPVLTAEDVPRLEPDLVAVASFHPNGYIREAVVRRLAAEGAAALPLLVLRATDWVEQVARPAAAAVRELLPSATDAQIVEALLLLARLSRRARPELRPLLEGTLALLAAPVMRGRLDALIARTDRAARRALVAWLLRSLHDAETIAWRALDDEDLAVRVAGARWLVEHSRQRDRVLPRLLSDAHPLLRQLGLLHLSNSDPSHVATLRAALMDRARNVRLLARWALARAGAQVSPVAIYRSVLGESTSSRDRATALAGLGETGEPADAAIAERHLAAPQPRLRAAALRAFVRLGGDDASAPARRALRDPSAGVRQVAREVLRRHPGWWTMADVEPLLVDDVDDGIRLSALELLRGAPKWARLRVLLDVMHSSSSGLRERAGVQLRSWLEGTTAASSRLRGTSSWSWSRDSARRQRRSRRTWPTS